ncbi:hypothetical protein NXS19_000218 [Fusarium pseudograminearum]|nr:hypothetical protein NXS19_000218 [Fusarium pseudograminearum]
MIMVSFALRVSPSHPGRQARSSSRLVSRREASPFRAHSPQPPQTASPFLQQTAQPPRTTSPFLQQSPMEGEFPIQKGLPRGRRPQQPEPQTPDKGYGLEPRKQRRQPPMYPPPRNESPVAPDSFDAPSTPNWNDFDRAEAHKSAIPAALSPFRAQFARSPGQATDSSLSPRLAQYASSPISDRSPSLPSPSFPSLQSQFPTRVRISHGCLTLMDHMTSDLSLSRAGH